jgi:hypothetical protein
MCPLLFRVEETYSTKPLDLDLNGSHFAMALHDCHPTPINPTACIMPAASAVSPLPHIPSVGVGSELRTQSYVGDPRSTSWQIGPDMLASFANLLDSR